MKLHEKLFLEAFKAAINNQKVFWDFQITQETWQLLFELSKIHKVLPMIFETVYDCPSIQSADNRLIGNIRHFSKSAMLNQVQKTAEFFRIYTELTKHNIHPLIVKGLVCRELYPNPDLRVSADEDILVEMKDFEKSLKLLKYCGMTPSKEVDVTCADEIGFIAENNISYIELHKHLFSKEAEAYGDLNRYFENAFTTCISMDIQGTTIYTIEPSMHLFYLICHAFKHFLHSGFGIRQVCDIVLFANAYGKEIDWQKLLVQCKEIRAGLFAAALFKIGKNYLTFDEEKACYPQEWQEIDIDEEELLLELLNSGIYGGSTMSRKHSSNITLDAVAAQKQGKKSGNGLKASLFPAAKSLEEQYTYLKKQPYLLPFAWGERIVKYCKETAKSEDNNAIDAVKIGNQRIELLKKYGILEK